MASDGDNKEKLIELLGRMARRDEGAFLELYDEFSAPLFSIAVRLLGDAKEAEEVIQDVFVSLWQKAEAYNPANSSPFTWAVSITRNKAIDRLRFRGRRIDSSVKISPPEHAPEIAAETDDAATAVLASERHRITREALNRLPEDQRAAIEMAFFDYLTHLQISERTNTPLGTVKARIRRGLLRLRELLPEECHD